MEFIVKSSLSEKQKCGCLITSQSHASKLSPTLERLDKASISLLKERVTKGDISNQIYAMRLFHDFPKSGFERILVVGVGNSGLSIKQFNDMMTQIITTLGETAAQDAALILDDFPVKNKDNVWKIRQFIEIYHATTYRFEKFKTEKNPQKRGLRRFTFLLSKHELKQAEEAINEARAIVEGIELVKNLANIPANICDPTYLAQFAKEFAKKHNKVNVAVLEEKDMAALKMGLLLSVTSGSTSKAKLITLEYRGGRKSDKPIVLVGKGVTFDTGGNTIKVPPNMIGMKYDMTGAASVLGVLQAAVRLGLPLNIIVVIPACENMPGPNATRPEDIVTSMAGITVEILNTDAEGRLILADALTYCERFNPEIVIDVATLTSGCFLALGFHASALMSNNEALTEQLMIASTKSGDRVWPLPIWEEYAEALNSEFADIANIPFTDVGARSITAACFLAKFTKNYKWAHLDIANTATGPKYRGATGRSVPLLVQYLLDYTAKQKG